MRRSVARLSQFRAELSQGYKCLFLAIGAIAAIVVAVIPDSRTSQLKAERYVKTVDGYNLVNAIGATVTIGVVAVIPDSRSSKLNG